MEVPQTTFYTRVRDETIKPNPFRWEPKTSHDIFGGKTVILFALPGAFTPVCSEFHLPGYEKDYFKFKRLGVDEIYCSAVNDAFVMFQWAKQLGIQHVKMLPDGNGDFAARMGMLEDRHELGFGYRSHRYSMLVKDGTIVQLFKESEKGDPLKVSHSKKMLSFVKTI